MQSHFPLPLGEPFLSFGREICTRRVVWVGFPDPADSLGGSLRSAPAARHPSCASWD